MSNSASYTPKLRSQSSLLEVFAARHRLKITLDDCRDQILRGKHGDLSDFYDGERLIAAFWGNGPRFSRLRARRIRLALEGGYGQPWAGGIGDDEALILFFPNEERSANFFIRALGIRRKRRVKAEVIERLGSYAKRSKTTSGTALQPAETPFTPGGGAMSQAFPERGAWARPRQDSRDSHRAGEAPSSTVVEYIRSRYLLAGTISPVEMAIR